MSKNEVLEDDIIEDNKKNEKIRNLYIWKEIFIIQDGRLEKITHKELKKDDYIIKYDQEKEFYIIDRDKRKIRPFVEDLLRKMNIETLQTKLLKLSVIMLIVTLVIQFFSLIVYFSWSWTIKELKNEIEKQNKPNINIWSGILLNNL